MRASGCRSPVRIRRDELRRPAAPTPDASKDSVTKEQLEQHEVFQSMQEGRPEVTSSA